MARSGGFKLYEQCGLSYYAHIFYSRTHASVWVRMRAQRPERFSSFARGNLIGRAIDHRGDVDLEVDMAVDEELEREASKAKAKAEIESFEELPF